MAKNPPTNAGEALKKEEGNGDPLWSSSLGNPMNRRAWQATVHGITKESDMTYRLNNNNIPEVDFV